MKITRTFTTAGSSPYDAIEFRTACSEIRNPDGSVVFRADDIEVPSAWSQVAVDVLAQKYFRKAGIPTRLRPVDEPGVPEWLRRKEADKAALAQLPEDQRYGGETSARQVFDRLAGTWTYWGWNGGYFDGESDAQRVLRRAALHAGAPVRRAQLAAVVQHRPALGLRHRRPGPGPLLRRPPQRRGAVLHLRLRTPAAARLLHPEHRRRPGEPRRHHGPVGARGAPVQVRLRHRHQLLQPARRERAAFGRRQVVRPDELPQDRRSRRRRDQVGRHHAARGQDGGGRRRSPGHRGVRRLEGGRGAEGRRAGRRLQAARASSERDHDRLPHRRTGRRGALRSEGEPGAEEGGARGAPGAAARERPAAGDPVRPPGLHPGRHSDLLDRLGLGCVPDRLRAELQQLGARDQRLPRAGARGPRVAAHPPHRRPGREDRSRPRACGTRSPTPPGPAPIRESSTTPRSTSGTPARTPAGSTPRIRARSTCSSTTRRAISPRST